MMNSSSYITIMFSLLATMTLSLDVVDAAGGSGSTLDNRVAAVTCNICTNGGTLTNPNQQVNVGSGQMWSCNYLQETVQDVDGSASGNQDEQIFCRRAQTLGNSCSCTGTPVTSTYVDLNSACNLCGNYPGVTPTSVGKAGIAAWTGIIGTQNCGGLFTMMNDGIISSNICPTVKNNAGPICCTGSSSTSSSSPGRSSIRGSRSTPLLSGAANDIPSSF